MSLLFALLYPNEARLPKDVPLPTDVAEAYKHVGITAGWPPRVKSWRTWRPDECPNLDGVLWDDAPWCDPIDPSDIDWATTEQLASPTWDAPVRTGVGGVSTDNVHGGTPLQDVSHVEVPTVVIDLQGRRHLVPLPVHSRGEGIVRRFGDPTGTQGDLQWIGVDMRVPDRPVMWECSALRPGPGFSTWFARNVVCWDLALPFDQVRKGITATDLPLGAGVARYEQLEAGEIDQALQIAANRYSKREIRWPARGTDGLYPTAPMVAGMRLVLRPDWEPDPKLGALTRHEQTLVDAMKAKPKKGKGLIVADRTHPDHGSNVRDVMDRRVRIRELGIRHRDLLALRS